MTATHLKNVGTGAKKDWGKLEISINSYEKEAGSFEMLDPSQAMIGLDLSHCGKVFEQIV